MWCRLIGSLCLVLAASIVPWSSFALAQECAAPKQCVETLEERITALEGAIKARIKAEKSLTAGERTSLAGLRTQIHELSAIEPEILLDDLSRDLVTWLDNIRGKIRDKKKLAAVLASLAKVQQELVTFSNQDRPAAIEKFADQLNSFIRAEALTPSERRALRVELFGTDKLAKALEQIETVSLLSAAERRTDSLSEILKLPEFTDVTASVLTSSGLPPKIVTLINDLLNAGKINNTATLRSFAEQLSTFLKGNTAIRTTHDLLRKELFEDPDATGSAARPLAVYLDIIEDAVPGAAARRRANQLVSLLDKAITAGAEKPAHEKAFRKLDVATALDTLAQKIAVVRAPLEPKIHIISAYFGDLKKNAHWRRRCHGTPALRDKCQRQSSCQVKSGGQVEDLWKELCGFDPVPFADPRIKGARVEYSCRTGNDDYWEKLDANPKYVGGGANRHARRRHVYLQHSVTEFSCDTTRP